jgi:hypothetical protein
VAIAENTLMVGAYQDEIGAAGSSGVVRMYAPNNSGGWPRVASLGSAEFGSQLGWSVAISNGLAVAGARLADMQGTNSGSIQIFQQQPAGGWISGVKLVGSDIQPNDQFGSSVGIDGNLVVAGSSIHGDVRGAVYVFERANTTGWTESAMLLASDGSRPDGFGASVAVSGRRIIAGAPGKDQGLGFEGAAYIFEDDGSSGFQQTEKLLPGDPVLGMSFGRSVSIAANEVIVGAPMLIDFDTTGGSAYIFQKDVTGDWIQQAKLVAADRFVGDQFGISVALGDGIAVVGSPGDDDLGSGGGTDPGSAYVFRKNLQGDWRLTHILNASDGADGNGFGRSVAVYGSTILVGAQFNNGVGAAYLFTVPEPSSAILILFGAISACLRWNRQLVRGHVVASGMMA